MGVDLFLPGCVLLTKLGFKIFADQRPRWIDVFRAFVAFPVDMTFLCFSYGAAALAYHELSTGQRFASSTVIGIALLGVVLALIANRLSKEAESAVDADRVVFAMACSAFGYLIAGTTLFFALGIGA